MSGFVYLLGNGAMPGYYKIGRTQGCPYERARQLSSRTCVPEPFTLICSIEVENEAREERFLHEFLADFRNSYDREFFRFGECHMPWVFGVFRHYPAALRFVQGQRLIRFPGIFNEEINPWAGGRDEPEMTPFCPDYAYFNPEAV